MANILIKRKTGTSTYEDLYASSKVEIITNSGGTSLQSLLDAKINTSARGAANGVASLDSNSKIPYSQLPSSVVGGMRFRGIVDLSAGTSEGNAVELSSVYSTLVNASNYSTTAEQEFGSYFIVNSAGWIKNSDGNTTTPTAYYRFSPTSTSFPPYSAEIGDDGDDSSPIYLERGDWVLLTAKVSPTTNAYYYLFSVINNVYGDATTSAKGIVTLSGDTLTSQLSGNNVITEGVLSTLLTADGTDLYNAGTAIAGKIAPSSHTHSQYQPVDTDLTTIAGLSNADSNFIVGNGSAWVVESGATARASLGLTIGTHVQAYDATLAGIATLNPTTDQMIYATASNTFAVTGLTSFARTLLDDADASTARSTLGLVIGTNVQAQNTHLQALADLSKTDGNFVVANGTTFVAESGATARTSLGVYSQQEVDDLLTNKPNIFYDTTTNSVVGDYIFDVI